MNTATENTPQGVWATRESQDAFVHSDASGDADLTVAVSHDSETGVPTIRMNLKAAVRVVMNGRELPNPTAAERVELLNELVELEVAANGGSTDDELEVLKSALDLALKMLGMTRE
jgi:hypothetical protein